LCYRCRLVLGERLSQFSFSCCLWQFLVCLVRGKILVLIFLKNFSDTSVSRLSSEPSVSICICSIFNYFEGHLTNYGHTIVGLPTTKLPTTKLCTTCSCDGGSNTSSCTNGSSSLSSATCDSSSALLLLICTHPDGDSVSVNLPLRVHGSWSNRQAYRYQDRRHDKALSYCSCSC
jgi:hypothetical protein